jgi:hypothetical protein
MVSVKSLKSPKKSNYLETLPDEIFMEIIIEMNYNTKGILSLCKTDKRFAKICSNEQIWKKLVQKKDPTLQKLPEDVKSWKEFYLHFLYISDFKTITSKVYSRLHSIILNIVEDQKKNNLPKRLFTDDGDNFTFAISEEEAFLKFVDHSIHKGNFLQKMKTYLQQDTDIIDDLEEQGTKWVAIDDILSRINNIVVEKEFF